MHQTKTTRRTMLKTGFAAAVGAAVNVSGAEAADQKLAPVSIKPKKKGETKVVYLGGDQLHNGMGQHQAMRGVLGPTGWRIMCTMDARYVTPKFISDADLLIITRWGGPIEAWCPEPFQECSMPNDGYMSDELQDAVVDQVMNRGMGFMALHCTIWSPDYHKLLNMMGIKPMMHGPVQTVHMHNFNADHPVSAGIPDFELPLDENFGVELINPDAVPLYESTGRDDKRHDIAGWALESGNGRVVGLAAGHTYTSWRHPEYQKLYWRGAHWTMKRDIPPLKG